MEFLTATCRICAQDYKTVVCTNESRINFRQILTFLTSRSASVQVEQTDELPQTICLICKQELSRTYRFLKQIEQSTELLKKLKKPVFETTIKKECDPDWAQSGVCLDYDGIQHFQKNKLCKQEGKETLVKEEATDFQCNTNCTVNIREETGLNSETDWMDNYDNEEDNSSMFEHGFQFVGITDEANKQYTCKVESFEDDKNDVTMSSTSENDTICTPSKEKRAAEETRHNLLPDKSKAKYQTVYEEFMEWQRRHKIKEFSENTLLTYFSSLTGKYKSSSLWTRYSMLRSTLNIYHNVNIAEYPKLRVFLKRKSVGFQPKKSKVFTPEEINKFLNTAPDNVYLATKVAFIMGIAGACRATEMHAMKVQDIQDLGTSLIVSIPSSRSEILRRFTLKDNFYKVCKMYMQLRPSYVKSDMFFLNFQNGKCTSQQIGINKFGKMGKQIATFLKIPSPELYTGHCFRRSSATMLVDAVGDIFALKGLINDSSNKIIYGIKCYKPIKPANEKYQQAASFPASNAGITGFNPTILNFMNSSILHSTVYNNQC